MSHDSMTWLRQPRLLSERALPGVHLRRTADRFRCESLEVPQEPLSQLIPNRTPAHQSLAFHRVLNINANSGQTKAPRSTNMNTENPTQSILNSEQLIALLREYDKCNYPENQFELALAP